MVEKEYELPDPKKNPNAAIVISYKTWKGVDYADRVWDKANWSRASRAAGLLLDICKGFDAAERCLSYLAQQFNEADLAWTLETITKHAHDWVQKNERRSNGPDARKRLFDAITKRRTSEQAASSGEPTAAGPILDVLRDHDVLPNSEPNRNTGTGSGNY